MTSTSEIADAERMMAECQALRRRIAELEAERMVCPPNDRRSKEPACLFGLARLIEANGTELKDILQGVAELLPTACQYPRHASARIEIDGQEYTARGFRDIARKQSVPIIVHGAEVGRIEVGYSGDGAPLEDDATQEGLRGLLGAVAERLGRTVERLRAEEPFRELIEDSADAVAVVDTAGRLLYLSPNAAKVAGGTALRRVGASLFDAVHPDDWTKVQDLLHATAADEAQGARPLSFRATRGDGTAQWLEGSAANLLADPSVRGIVLTFRDATERRRAEERLRESEARFRGVAGAFAGVVWEMNESFTVTHISGRVREMFGCDPEEMIGRRFDLQIAAEDRERVCAAIARAFERREPIKDFESWGVTKGEHRIRMVTNAAPVFAPSGHFLGYRGTHIDITEVHWARHRREILLRVHEMTEESDAAISAFLCEAFAEQTDSPMSFFGMMEPDESAMIAHIFSPGAMSECQVKEKPLRFPIGTAGLWAEPVRRRELMMVNDYQATPLKRGLPVGHVPLTRYLGVPVIRKGKVIAMAGVANKAAPYDGEDVMRLRLIATTTADFIASRRAEQEARQSDRRLRTFIDFTGDWEYWLMPDGRHLYDSPSCERITGYRTDEFRADPELISRIVHPEDRALFGAHLCLEAASSGSELELKFRIIRKGDDVRWIHHICRPICQEDGAFAGTRVSNRDITEQRRAEEALQQSEARFRTLFENSADAMFVLIDGICVDCNQAALSMLRARRREEVVGARSISFSPEFQPDGSPSDAKMAQLASEAAEQGTKRFEWLNRRLDGTEFFAEVVATHVMIRGKSALLGTWRDITERKRSEAALRKADRRKNEFLAMLSHELRNPLAPIRNSLYILDRVAPDGEQARRAKAIINRQVDHLSRLVDDLLDVTRINRGKVQLKRERLDLNELAQCTIEDHRGAFVAGGIELEVRAAPTALWVEGDRTRLVQVLGNLLQNAAKFTSRGGKATVSVGGSSARKQATISVHDTGRGIAPEILPRLFEAFTQADTTLDRSKGGLGLGLALVKGLIEMHGGEVSAASGGPGKGSTFTFALPLEQDPARELRPASAARSAPRRRVLVIEDNLDAADSLREALKLRGHEVAVAYGGVEGVQKARAIAPEIVLSDIGLPEMNGYEVARAIRSDGELSRVILVALTGYAGPEDVEKAKEAGFDAHLAKPLSVPALEEILATAGDPAGAAGDAPRRTAGLDCT